jgi:histone H1/5
MMSAVSGPAEDNGKQESAENGAGVLANLPRTRPQRASARRTAARRAGAGTQQAPRPAKASPTKKASKTVKAAASNGRAATTAKTAAKPKAKTGTKVTGTAKRSASVGARARRPAAAPKAAAPKAIAAPKAARPRRTTKPPVAEPVPRQGFESEEERATGAVQPPGGTELVSTAAEILGELTKAGISGGERLLRDVLSRLGR